MVLCFAGRGTHNAFVVGRRRTQERLLACRPGSRRSVWLTGGIAMLWDSSFLEAMREAGGPSATNSLAEYSRMGAKPYKAHAGMLGDELAPYGSRSFKLHQGDCAGMLGLRPGLPQNCIPGLSSAQLRTVTAQATSSTHRPCAASNPPLLMPQPHARMRSSSKQSAGTACHLQPHVLVDCHTHAHTHTHSPGAAGSGCVRSHAHMLCPACRNTRPPPPRQSCPRAPRPAGSPSAPRVLQEIHHKAGSASAQPRRHLLLLLLCRRGRWLHAGPAALLGHLQRARRHAVTAPVGVGQRAQPAPQVARAAPPEQHVPVCGPRPKASQGQGTGDGEGGGGGGARGQGAAGRRRMSRALEGRMLEGQRAMRGGWHGWQGMAVRGVRLRPRHQQSRSTWLVRLGASPPCTHAGQCTAPPPPALCPTFGTCAPPGQ